VTCSENYRRHSYKRSMITISITLVSSNQFNHDFSHLLILQSFKTCKFKLRAF